MERVKEAARLLALEGGSKQAKLLLLDAFSKQPICIVAHNLADYHKEQEQYEEAYHYALQAVAWQPKTYSPYALLGELSMRRGDNHSAQQWLEKAYNRFQSPVVAHNLATLYKAQQKYEQAARLFIKSYETDDYGLMHAVECFVLANDFQHAKKWIAIIEQEQQRFIGEVELGELYGRIGDYQKSAVWYAKGYQHYAHTGEWIADYVWVLHQLGNEEQKKAVITAFMEQCTQTMADLADKTLEDGWTEEEVAEEEAQLRANMERVNSAHLQHHIMMQNEPSIASRCYTFFCPMHDEGHGDSELDG